MRRLRVVGLFQSGMNIETLGMDEWRDALPAAGSEVFHLPEALAVIDEYARGELRLYGGFNGDRPVALLPAFVRRWPIGGAVLSPPPGLGVFRLGPLVMPASPKRRKWEKLNREFTAGVLDVLDVDRSDTVFRAICPADYTDPRPYRWADFDVETAFTYAVETAGRTTEELLGSFSKSLRREIRDCQDSDVTVEVAAVDAARAVYDATASRYAEQGREFPQPWPYVRDLTSALAAVDRCRVYVARDPDGEFLSGVTVLYSDDTAYFWQGGNRAVYDGVAVNSLLHWRILRDLVEDPPVESVDRYDLQGANTERLCRYKAKFGGELVPYYVVESSGVHVDVAKRAYRMLTA